MKINERERNLVEKKEVREGKGRTGKERGRGKERLLTKLTANIPSAQKILQLPISVMEDKDNQRYKWPEIWEHGHGRESV